MITVNKALICDDVRVEIGGKLMLIGVYPADDVAVSSFPTDIFLYSYVEATSTDARTCLGVGIVEDSDGTKVLENPMKFIALANKTMPLFSPMPFRAAKPGTFKVKWVLNDGENVDVCRITIDTPKT